MVAVSTDQGKWTAPWKALLFPLDEWSGDFRRVRGGGAWRVPNGGAPVTLDRPGQYEPAPIVGRVDKVWVEDGSVCASGVLDPAVTLESLRPQADLSDPGVRVEMVDLGDGEFGSELIADTLRAIRLSAGVPAWADVWIEVGQR